MLRLLNTRFQRTYFNKVMTAHRVEEGTPLKFIKQNGETVVRSVEGSSGEAAAFAGIAYSRFAPPAQVPLAADDVVPASLSIEMARTPVTGQLFVSLDGVAATIVAIAPAASGEVQLSGDTLVFHADDEGASVYYQMLYSPTVEEARTIVGDAPIGGVPADAMETIGVIKQGEVGLSCFDASANWNNALFVKTAANGRLTPAAANDAERIPGVIVKNAPNSADPFLVIELNIA